MSVETMEVTQDESCDSEDSLENSNENEKELSNIAAYKTQIKKNELNYEAHLGLIQSLRKISELEDLRRAYQAMNKIYPLSPELWLEWLSDEQKICTTQEERNFITELFQKSVKEYLSVKVWIEYIMFMLGGNSIEDTRRICEEALTAAGIHLSEGILVWQAVILAEQQYFLSLDPNDTKSQEKQRKRIQNLYRRQARVPLMNMEKDVFLLEASKWFDGELDAQIKRDLDNSYQKMMEKLPLEEALLRANDDTEKLEVYRKYIDSVRAHDNPAVIQNVYERTVCDLCLNAGIWEEYVRFAMEQFSSASYVILPVCERSQLNCPWSGVLFELHINALQKFKEEIGTEQLQHKIQDALNKTLKVVVFNEAELIKVWMSFLVYLRREIDWEKNSPNPQLEAFRQSCKDAISFIDSNLGETADSECTIARFQATVEAELARDMEAARAIWNEHIMKRNNNFKNANLWLEFINLERNFGNDKRCRKLYRRAIERVWENLELVGISFLQFEQTLGTLETMMDFENRFKDRLLTVQKKRMEDAAKEEKKKDLMDKSKIKSKMKDNGSTQPIVSAHSLKSKNVSPSNRSLTPTDRPTAAASKGSKRRHSSAELSPPPGYKPTQEQNGNKKQKVSGAGEFVEHNPSADHRTVFLSNMDYNVGEEEIVAVFSDCGDIDTFRTAKDFRGRSKGFGYLVFKEASSVPEALKRDRTPVGVRPLFVSPCNPKNKDHAFKFSTRMEKQKLFVKGLPFSMTEEEVRSCFEPHGKVKALRLVTHRNGHSKGTCYIEYHDAETAQRVMQQMDGAVLKDHQISVAVSNPSASKSQLNVMDKATTARVPGRQRAQLNLVPRSLLRTATNSLTQSKTASQDENKGITQTSPITAKKSNEDFRKMLLK